MASRFCRSLALGLALSFAGVTMAVAADAETGLAAVYSDKLNGHTTASKERFDQKKLTAAHKTHPYGTRLRVTNLSNKRSVVVRINDRGPTQEGRILDLSRAAASKLGIGPHSMAKVEAVVLAK